MVLIPRSPGRRRPFTVEPDDRGCAVRLERAVVVGLGGAALLMATAHAAVPNLPFAPSLAQDANPVRRFFEVAGEQNGWAWLNVVLLATGAALHLVAGLLWRRAGRRAAAWWGTAAVLAALSLDDLVGLHERMTGLGVELGGGSGLLAAAWVVPGAAVAVGVVVAFGWLARSLDRHGRRLLLGGLALFLAGAFGLETVGHAVLEDRGPSATYGGLVLVEELAEAWGAVLMAATGAAAVVLRTGPGDGVELRAR